MSMEALVANMLVEIDKKYKEKARKIPGKEHLSLEERLFYLKTLRAEKHEKISQAQKLLQVYPELDHSTSNQAA